MIKRSFHFFWFRRDGAWMTMQHCITRCIQENQYFLFSFSMKILSKLETSDKRVDFIHRTLTELKSELKKLGSDVVFSWNSLFGFTADFNRSQIVLRIMIMSRTHKNEMLKLLHCLNDKGASFQTFKDQCIFEKDEVLKDDGKPYTVYTPYSNGRLS